MVFSSIWLIARINIGAGGASMNPTVTETKIGNTLYIVSAECSPTAKETLEEKLERIISRNIADVLPSSNDYQLNSEKARK